MTHTDTMENNDRRIFIVGAGVAGLIAAHHLEKAGYQPTILDQNDRVGGRLYTDRKDGFLLDRGFQVLLSAYPEVNRYLDLEALNTQAFEAGAIVFYKGKAIDLYDPLRDRSKALPMLFAGIGSLRDKWLVYKLTQELKSQQVSNLFVQHAPTTMDFLGQYGFSTRIINRFFRPFFGGIFLENNLRTSSNMFRFVFKMFSEGNAIVPNKGIEQVPVQLAQKLKHTTFHLGTTVRQVLPNEIVTDHGHTIPYEKVIIATSPYEIVPNLSNQGMQWHHTLNLYFKTNKGVLSRKAIALIADEEKLINNFCVISDIAKGYSPAGQQLISVSLKPSIHWSDQLPGLVAEELASFVQLPPSSLKFLDKYLVKEALPALEMVQHNMEPRATRLTDRIFLAGDYLLNGSLDAAMRSGRLAAHALINT